MANSNSITLQKPLETDVYDIAVFNSNSTIIEDSINKVLEQVVWQEW